jgi:hypothetical protein
MVSSALDLFPAVRKETQTMDIYDTIPGTTAPPSCSTTSIRKKSTMCKLASWTVKSAGVISDFPFALWSEYGVNTLLRSKCYS